MKRVIKRELLDDLPADHSGAVGSRRDLRRLNWLMGHSRILSRLLRSAGNGQIVNRVVELGAGDGWATLQAARRLASHWPRLELVLVDKSDVVGERTRAGFRALGWRLTTVLADAFEWISGQMEPADAIIGNLFLHHFSNEKLTELFRLAAARTKLFVATEPRRGQASLWMSRFTPWIGCNWVTRHDAVASVRAGFTGRELSALWPPDSRWRVRERGAGLFTHTFVAATRV